MSPIWTHRLENAPKRVNHASAAVGHIIYSFGGYCTGEDYESKRPIVVHSLDTNTLEWSLVPYKYDSMDDIPFNRYGHTVIADGHMIYLWGGRNDENACNVLFAFSSLTLKWSRPKVSRVTPDARDGHSATVCRRKMYIFGGFEEDSERFSQDVHSLDLDFFTWNYIVTDGMPPAFRDFHSLSCIDETLYVFGGRSDKEGPYHTREEVYENQIVCLNLKSLTWSRPVTKNAPIGRRSHSAFVFNKCLYIFGGFNGLTNQHFNDLHMYNPVTSDWTEVSTHGAPPCPRRRQSCNLVKSQLYLFGGTSPTENFNSTNPLLSPDLRLSDQSDLFVLDFSPSLETLAKLVIIKHGLSTTDLPARIQKEIEVTWLKTSAPRNSANTG